jgi:hypothetical protein
MIEKFAEKFKGSSMVKLGCGEIDFRTAVFSNIRRTI